MTAESGRGLPVWGLLVIVVVYPAIIQGGVLAADIAGIADEPGRAA